MIRLKTLLITLLLPLTLAAQPQKARQATFTLTTYTADGTVIATAPGVFVSKDGMALSAWTPFKDAVRAEVKDARGRTFKVACLYGASALYNVARFRIDGISDAATLTPATAPAKEGTTAYIMAATPQKTAVSRTELFNTNYTYTILESVQAIKDNAAQYDGAAVVNDKGDLLGLFNYSTTVQSAADARYVNAFTTNALSTSDPTLSQTHLRLALPPAEKDAQLALMLAGERRGDYQLGAANDFIAAFPTSVDGYFSRANVLADSRKYAEADQTMQQCVQKAKDKAEAHFDYSRLISNYLTIVAPSDTTGTTYTAWTWDKAKSEADAAVAANDMPIYRQQVAETLLGQQKYQEAYDAFMALTAGNKLQGEPYYKAALAKANLPGTTNEETIDLLSKAIEASDTTIAANYFYTRAVLYDAMGKYRDALRDYIVYENLDFANLTGAFYYQREQCERKGKFWQPAMQDIAHAVLLAPRNATYWGEWASLALQLNQLEDAIRAADKCLLFSPDAADAYLIKGIALCEQGKKADGRTAIQKAQELGNEQAASYLEKYK